MFKSNAVAIAPCVDLRIAPALLNPVAIAQSEFPQHFLDCRAQGQTRFVFAATIRRVRYAAKNRLAECYVTVQLEKEAGSEPFINRLAEVIAQPQSCLQEEVYFLIQWNGEQHIIPVLNIFFRHTTARLSSYRGREE